MAATKVDSVPTDVNGIVRQWLETHGYDGLCGDECGCGLNDLMPCSSDDISDCAPGYRTICPGDFDCEFGGGCDWHMSTTRPASPETSSEAADCTTAPEVDIASGDDTSSSGGAVAGSEGVE